jgi:hypothetical protein
VPAACKRGMVVNLTIDVIIPTYGRPQRVGGLVNALAKHLAPGDRMYVVWQGKDRPALHETDSIHCFHSRPPNLPGARNRGIAEGTGDICLFLDDDVEIISPDLLAAHRAAHLPHDVGGVAGCVGAPLFPRTGGEPSTYDETTGQLVQDFSGESSTDAISVMGAHMSFKRRALADIGGFDEGFRGNALWEEIDVAFRVRKAGWKIHYCAGAKVKHSLSPVRQYRLFRGPPCQAEALPLVAEVLEIPAGIPVAQKRHFVETRSRAGLGRGARSVLRHRAICGEKCYKTTLVIGGFISSSTKLHGTQPSV